MLVVVTVARFLFLMRCLIDEFIHVCSDGLILTILFCIYNLDMSSIFPLYLWSKFFIYSLFKDVQSKRISHMFQSDASWKISFFLLNVLPSENKDYYYYYYY